MPVILATQEEEIRRITIQCQPRQIVCRTLSQKNPSQKRDGGAAQGVDLKFKPQYCKKKNSLEKPQMDTSILKEAEILKYVKVGRIEQFVNYNT
jgi:hypothetical protein